jgi:putative membrane protein
MIVLERPNALKLFFTLRGSVLPRIAPSLATCTALAVLVTLTDGFLFRWKVTLTPVPFTLIGLALAIFLGFRNSAAYERFWEARKLWGDVIHRSRTLARQVGCLPDLPAARTPSGPTRTRARAWSAAPSAMRMRCGTSCAAATPAPSSRGGCGPRSISGSSDRVSAATISCAATRPTSAHGCAPATSLRPVAAEIDKSIAVLAAAQAGCERIQSTPIPFAYTLLLHRTAYIYCFLLPFGLIDLIGFMTPFVVAIVAYTFFGLDALGDEIEHPFGLSAHHLPLEALCRTIEINLLEALGEPDLPSSLLPQDGFLH